MWNEANENAPVSGMVIFAVLQNQPCVYIGSISQDNKDYRCMNMRTGAPAHFQVSSIKKWKQVVLGVEPSTEADKLFKALGFDKSSFVSGLYVKSIPSVGNRKILVKEDGSSWVSENGEKTSFSRNELIAVMQKVLELEGRTWF